MNFINAVKKGKKIRLKKDVAMWERLGYPDYWFDVRLIKNKGLSYWGISFDDIMRTDWEVK
jgi:hypothetical protein